MAYVDPQFNITQERLLAVSANGTATGATANSLADYAYLPKLKRAAVISAVRVLVKVIPPATFTVPLLVFLNGTNTFAVATLATATAGEMVDATMTTANTTFTAGAQPALKMLGTATASAQLTGTYDVVADLKERPV